MQDYTLTNGEATLTVDPTGAWVTSLQDDRGEILFPRRPLKTVTGDTKLRGGCHVCVPQFGPALESAGLAQHGFGRDSLWTLLERSPNSLVFSLAPTHVEYQNLQVVLTYILTPASLQMDLSLYNDSARELRIAPAFHPYFATGRAATIGIDDETIAVEEYADTKFLVGEQKLLEVGGRQLTLTSSELTTWALWSDRLDEYFCVEPTLGGNRFLLEEIDEAERLGPNKSCTVSFKIAW